MQDTPASASAFSSPSPGTGRNLQAREERGAQFSKAKESQNSFNDALATIALARVLPLVESRETGNEAKLCLHTIPVVRLLINALVRTELSCAKVSSVLRYPVCLSLARSLYCFLSAPEWVCASPSSTGFPRRRQAVTSVLSRSVVATCECRQILLIRQLYPHRWFDGSLLSYKAILWHLDVLISFTM